MKKKNKVKWIGSGIFTGICLCLTQAKSMELGGFDVEMGTGEGQEYPSDWWEETQTNGKEKQKSDQKQNRSRNIGRSRRNRIIPGDILMGEGITEEVSPEIRRKVQKKITSLCRNREFIKIVIQRGTAEQHDRRWDRNGTGRRFCYGNSNSNDNSGCYRNSDTFRLTFAISCADHTDTGLLFPVYAGSLRTMFNFAGLFCVFLSSPSSSEIKESLMWKSSQRGRWGLSLYAIITRNASGGAKETVFSWRWSLQKGK